MSLSGWFLSELQCRCVYVSVKVVPLTFTVQVCVRLSQGCCSHIHSAGVWMCCRCSYTFLFLSRLSLRDLHSRCLLQYVSPSYSRPSSAGVSYLSVSILLSQASPHREVETTGVIQITPAFPAHVVVIERSSQSPLSQVCLRDGRGPLRSRELMSVKMRVSLPSLFPLSSLHLRRAVNPGLDFWGLFLISCS